MNNEISREMSNDKLRVEGLYAKGIGCFPKAIAIDRHIPNAAKAIYGYLCAFAGGGETAFPAVGTVISELAISKDFFYSNMNWLLENGYIKRERERSGKTFGHNIYTLARFVTRYSAPFPEGLTEGEIRMYKTVSKEGIIREAVVMGESVSEHKGVTEYAPEANVSMDIRELIREIEGRING